MKKYNILMSLLMISISLFCFCDNAFAASGQAYIHYYNEGSANRSLTYTEAKPHLQSMGYSVTGYNAVGITPYTLGELMNAKIFVVHNHGLAGIQYMGTDGSEYIAGKDTPVLDKVISINNLSSGSLKNLKIAILYGCGTGFVGSIKGDLPALIVNKGATAAVAWKVDTYVPGVNEWNRLFFEKAKTDTIVESYRHADYWLESILGSYQASVMANNRNEAGNIYTTIY